MYETAPTKPAPARGARQGRGWIAAFDELLARPVSMRALALLRVLAGPIVLLHLEPFLTDSLDGRTYRDAFHEPYAAWYPELPEAVYIGLLWLAAAAAVAMSLGLLTRLATGTTFAIVTYNLFLSTTHFHNNRAYLAIVLGLLAVAPCGRELSLDAWLRRRRGRPALALSAPAWPLWLLRFESSAIYGASGLSKLLDPDWFGGTVTWQRGVAAARLGDLGPHRPRLPRRGRPGDRPHRALSRGRALVARQPLPGRLGRGRLPRRDRGLGLDPEHAGIDPPSGGVMSTSA